MMNILHIFLLFCYFGFLCFGGGNALTPLYIDHLVNEQHWMTLQEFGDLTAISQMTPGPIGINSATYIGYVAPGVSSPSLSAPIWGILGSTLCTLVVVVPSYILTLYMSHLIQRHRDSTIVKGIFSGLRPVVVGMIASAALLLMNEANFGSQTQEIVASVLICLGAFAGVYWLKIHPILIIILSGIAGFLIY